MDETVKTLIEVSKPLLGVLVGYFLNAYRLRWRERKVESNVRALLRLEVDENLANLRYYKSGVDVRSAGAPYQDDVLPGQMPLANSLSGVRLPEWNHQSYKSLLSSIPNALNPEEIIKIYRFHAQLDELGLIQERKHGAWLKEVNEGAAKLLNDGNPLEGRT
jgi:hypothetical protein